MSESTKSQNISRGIQWHPGKVNVIHQYTKCHTCMLHHPWNSNVLLNNICRSRSPQKQQCTRDLMISKPLWKKWTILRLSKKYDRIRLPALNFAFELIYVHGLSVQSTRSLERTGQELSSYSGVLTFGISRTTIWSISLKDCFFPVVICDSSLSQTVFQPLWYMSSKEIQKNIFQKLFFYETWLIIHYSLDSGCWLCSHPDPELPTRLLLSDLQPS